MAQRIYNHFKVTVKATDAAFAQYFDAFAYFDDNRRVSGLFCPAFGVICWRFWSFHKRGLTDFFDAGWLANRRAVRLGRMLDPIADKLMVATCRALLLGYDIVTDYLDCRRLFYAARFWCRACAIMNVFALPVSTLANIKPPFKWLPSAFCWSMKAAVW